MEVKLALAEGGELSLRQRPVRHLHIQADEDAFLFGLALPILNCADRETAHLFEHLAMRGDGPSADLFYKWESAGSARWWQAFTSARCISFEVASYTPESFVESSALLSSAVFDFRTCMEKFREEGDHLSGRMAVEHSRGASQRTLLLEAAELALLNIVVPPDLPTEIENVTHWHAGNVTATEALWFTYGRMNGADAFEIVEKAHQGLANTGRVIQAEIAQDAGGATVSLPPDFPGPVAVWLGPSPHQEPAMALAVRSLHHGLLRNINVHRQMRSALSAGIYMPASTHFPDHFNCILTVGLDGAAASGRDPVETLAAIWRQNAAESTAVARASIDAWLGRQFHYVPFRRPYGSKVFGRLREGALYGGDVPLLARPDLLAEAAHQLLQSSPERVIDAAMQGSALLTSGGRHVH